MSKTYFFSDPHYHHKNIIKGISNWEDKSGCRDFSTMEKHNTTIVDDINSTVREDDILYCLGDWSFGGIDKIWEFRKQIKCKNIHLTLGNHDHHIESNKILKIPMSDVSVLRNLEIWFRTNPNYPDTVYVDAQELFKSVSHYKEIKVNGQRIVLCHYAMRVWNKGHHGSWMLFGHSHGTLPEYKITTYSNQLFYPVSLGPFKTMDVGIDAIYKIKGNYKPLEFSEIRNIFKNKVKLNIDHHNENTQ